MDLREFGDLEEAARKARLDALREFLGLQTSVPCGSEMSSSSVCESPTRFSIKRIRAEQTGSVFTDRFKPILVDTQLAPAQAEENKKHRAGGQ